MGNIDSIPLYSQAKSLTQFIMGDSAGARDTQNNFIYNNTFPLTSQLSSLGYAIAGDNDKALDLQKKFSDDMVRIIDSIPVAGHIKGGVHYAIGETKEGDAAMKAASHSTGSLVGGIGGFVVGGPVGAAAGGIAGGAAMDGLISGSDKIINKDKAKPYGYVAAGTQIVNAINKKDEITPGQGFDMAMLPLGDALGGLVGGKAFGEVGETGMSVKGGGAISAAGDAAMAGKNLKPLGGGAKKNPGVNGNYLGLDKKALDNRANQLNLNHQRSGPGRPAGYRGIATKADLNNHANQMNPNHPLYRSG